MAEEGSEVSVPSQRLFGVSRTVKTSHPRPTVPFISKASLKLFADEARPGGNTLALTQGDPHFSKKNSRCTGGLEGDAQRLAPHLSG